MERVSFQNLIACVISEQPPRVWSLLVTVFGELAQDRNTTISGTLLGRFTNCIGIKPEAMRVSLHRLRKDGWIESHRQGRTSQYALTDWGRSQSAQASPRIYAATPAMTQAWLILTDPGQPAREQTPGNAVLTPHMQIAPMRLAAADVFSIPIAREEEFPDWARSKVCDPKTVEQSHDLARKLKRLQTDLRRSNVLSALETAVLRVLIVHSWRRIILKTPTLPDHVFPTKWAGPACRAIVAELLEHLPRQNLADL